MAAVYARIAAVTGARRFSQAISEGDGISIVVPVTDPGDARLAEEEGAEAIAIHGAVHDVREATSLPLLWRPHALPRAEPRTVGPRAWRGYRRRRAP